MNAKQLRNYLDMVIAMNPRADVYINGNHINANADDNGDVDIYEVTQ